VAKAAMAEAAAFCTFHIPGGVMMAVCWADG
jgi:hypothetical protein